MVGTQRISEKQLVAGAAVAVPRHIDVTGGNIPEVQDAIGAFCETNPFCDRLSRLQVLARRLSSAAR